MRTRILAFVACLSAACGTASSGGADVPADAADAADAPADAADVPADGIADPGTSDTPADVPADAADAADVADVPADVADAADAADAPADAADVPPAPYPAEPGRRCALDALVALVQVGGYEGTVSGFDAYATVYDRPNPWYGEPELSDAACAFYRFAPGGCGACPDGQVCGRTGGCVPAQAPVPGARLVLSAGGQEQAFDADPTTGALWGTVTLPGTTFGARLEWAGQVVTLDGLAVPAGVGGLSGSLPGSYDQPTSLDLAWTPPAEGGKVFTHIPINHHAGGPTFTECLVDASTGALHADGAMLKPLAVITGLEFQGIDHLRIAAVDTPAGCVEFRFRIQQYVNLF